MTPATRAGRGRSSRLVSPEHARHTTTAGRPLLMAVVSVSGSALLQACSDMLPTPPLNDLGQLTNWWNTHGTAMAALSVLRVVGLSMCCYLAVLSMLALTAALTRWQWMATLTGWLATPALRRLFIGCGLAITLTAHPAGTASASAAGLAAYASVPTAQPAVAVSASATELTAYASAPTTQPAEHQALTSPNATPPHHHTTLTATDIGPTTALTSPNATPPHHHTTLTTTDIGPIGPNAGEPSDALTAQHHTVATNTDKPSDALTAQHDDTNPNTSPNATPPHHHTTLTATDIGPTNTTPNTAPPHHHTTLTTTDIGPIGPNAGEPSDALTAQHHTVATNTDKPSDALTAQHDDTNPNTSPNATPPHHHTTLTTTDIGPIGPNAGEPSDALTAQHHTNTATANTGQRLNTPNSPAFNMPRGSTWIVAPGDNLWGISAATVLERTGRTEIATVAQYWLELIETNSDTLGDNPSLIYPGQAIQLPD